MSIKVGARGRAEDTVTLQNTAQAIGSGSLPVFGTPFLCALAERAAVAALAPLLGADECSVGTRLALTHDAATPVGLRVWAEAEVTQVDRRRIVFSVHAWDEAGPIGGGLHERFVVPADRFLAKAQARKGGE